MSRSRGRQERGLRRANAIQLSATDVLAPTTMKNAAKCDTSCELQKLVSHQVFERTLRFRDKPGSMLVGVRSQQPTFLSFVQTEERSVNCAPPASERKMAFRPLSLWGEDENAGPSAALPVWMHNLQSVDADGTVLASSTALVANPARQRNNLKLFLRLRSSKETRWI